jgi:hypothetical protein
MAFQSKVASLNFTQASWATKKAQIKDGKMGYYIAAPGDKRLAAVAPSDKVLLTGRQLGPQGTAVVESVCRNLQGTQFQLVVTLF